MKKHKARIDGCQGVAKWLLSDV